MNYISELKNCEKFLLESEVIWSNEPLFQYPNIPPHVRDLLDTLSKLTLEELIKLEKLEDISFLSGDLFDYFKGIKDKLINFPKILKDYKVSQKDLKGITLKKSHEILRIMDLLKEYKFEKVIDIGGGKGHLSFLMAKYFNNQEYICIDQDENLQESAIKSFSQLDKIAFKKLNYHAEIINEKSQIQILKNDLLLGLHACGDLSMHLLNLFKNQNGSLLNFPCCYHKCKQLNLSGEMKIQLNHFALNLANRSKVPLSLKDYQNRYQIKSFRYTLEMAYYDLHQEHLTPLGSAPKDIYSKNFKDYLNFYEISGISSTALEDYREKVHQYILLETLRNPIGRILEQYILLDRALYLEKNDKSVELYEVFDANYSPRNIALFCKN